MAQSIQSSLVVVNETDLRGRALLALIQKYITFPGAYYGYKTEGANPDIRYPALFVEPKVQVPTMMTTAKFHIKWTFAIYWYVRENRSEDAVTLANFVAEALIKLFSNDALGDLQSANPPSNNFKNYAGFWLDSEMTDIKWSTNYLDPDAQGARTERVGRMMFTIEDVVLK